METDSITDLDNEQAKREFPHLFHHLHTARETKTFSDHAARFGLVFLVRRRNSNSMT